MLEKKHQHFSFYEKTHKEKFTVKVRKKIGNVLLNASQLMGTLTVGLLVVGITASVLDKSRNTDPVVVAVPLANYEKIQQEIDSKMHNITNEFNSQLYHLKNKDTILKMIGADPHVIMDMTTSDTILFSHIQEEKYASYTNYYVIEFKENKAKTIYMRYPDNTKLNYFKNNNIPFSIIKKEKENIFEPGDLIKIDIN